MRIVSSRLSRKFASQLALSMALSAPFALAALATFAPQVAYAQDAPKPKPKKKPKADAPAATPEPAPAPAPAPVDTAATPAPAAEASASVTASADSKEATTASSGEDITDVYEKPGKHYYFIGLRYTHTIIPKFLINAFVNEGATVHSNSIGVAADIRKDGFSLIPTLSYTEYGTGDILFMQKGQPDIPQNYSMVNSSMKAIYFSADLLWSTNLHKNWDFEYGAGFGMGIIFGDLVTNWVYDSPNGNLTGSNGHHYAPCQVGDTFTGCNTKDHQNATTAKVGGYSEPSWAGGGSKPNIFPHLAIPQIGVRWKPIKQVEARALVGFSITGFFVGLNVAYGLERPSTDAGETKSESNRDSKGSDSKSEEKK